MSWNYVELSHAAKEHGGPESLLTAIYDGGLIVGRIQGGVIAGLMMLATGGIAFLVNRMVEHKKARATAAKAILISRLDSETKAKTALLDESAQPDEIISTKN